MKKNQQRVRGVSKYQINLNKLKTNLSNHEDIRNQNYSTRYTNPFVVLVLSGALNPVHNMHLHSFEVAKEYIERTFDKVVLGGYMCPSSDKYVKDKLGQKAMTLVHRNKLCSLMTDDSDWVETCEWGLAFAGGIMIEIEKILKSEFKSEKFEIWLIAGADHASRLKLYTKPKKTICLGRPGDTIKLHKELKEFGNVPESFILVDKDLEDISSTKNQIINR